MNIKLDHINISVTNLKESIQWYGKVFGFELAEKGKTGRGYNYAIVANNNSMICMTEQPKRKSADKFDDATAHHIYHFGIRVSDVEKWQETIKAHNIHVYFGGEVDYPFSTSWYVHDPSGHEIDVSYTASGKMQFPALATNY